MAHDPKTFGSAATKVYEGHTKMHNGVITFLKRYQIDLRLRAKLRAMEWIKKKTIQSIWHIILLIKFHKKENYLIWEKCNNRSLTDSQWLWLNLDWIVEYLWFLDEFWVGNKKVCCALCQLCQGCTRFLKWCRSKFSFQRLLTICLWHLRNYWFRIRTIFDFSPLDRVLVANWGKAIVLKVHLDSLRWIVSTDCIVRNTTIAWLQLLSLR